MPTQTGELGVTFPDNTLQTTAAIAGTSGFGGIQYTQVFTASAVWVCPTGVTRVRATVVGGGGGSTDDGGDTQFGGSGGVAIGVYTVVPGTSYSITVGLGGSGGTGGSSTNGTSSSFSTFCSATGGEKAGIYTPGATGIGSGGNIRNSTVGNANSYLTTSTVLGVYPFLAGEVYILQPYFSTGLPYSVSGRYAAGLGCFAAPGIGGAVVLEY